MKGSRLVAITRHYSNPRGYIFLEVKLGEIAAFMIGGGS
jgi:hypothetical protein